MAYFDDEGYLEPLDYEPPQDFGDFNPIQGPREEPEQFLSGAQYAEPQRMAPPPEPRPPEPWSEGDNMYQQKLLNASSQLRQLRSSGTLSPEEADRLQGNIDRDLQPLQVRQSILLEQQRIKAEKQVMQQHALANTINSQGLAADAQSFEQRVPLVRFPGGREVPFYYDGSKWLPMPPDESQRDQRTAQMEQEAAQREQAQESAAAQREQEQEDANAEREQQRELEQRQMEWERHQMQMEAEGGPGTSLPRPEAQGQSERQRVETLAAQMGLDHMPGIVDQAMEQMDLMRTWARHPTPSGVPVRMNPLARALWEELTAPPERPAPPAPGVTLQGRTAEEWRAEDAARPRGVDVWGGQAMSEFPDRPPAGAPYPGLEPSGRPDVENTRVSAATGRPYQQTIYAQGEGPQPPGAQFFPRTTATHDSAIRNQAIRDITARVNRDNAILDGEPTPGSLWGTNPNPGTPAEREERRQALIEQRYRELLRTQNLSPAGGERIPRGQTPISGPAGGAALPSEQGGTGSTIQGMGGMVGAAQGQPAPSQGGGFGDFMRSEIRGASNITGRQPAAPAPAPQQPSPRQHLDTVQQNLQRLRQAGTINQEDSTRVGQSISRVREILEIGDNATSEQRRELGRLWSDLQQPLAAGPGRMTQAVRAAPTEQLRQRLEFPGIDQMERATIETELRRRGVR